MCSLPSAHGASRGSMELGGNPLFSKVSTEDKPLPTARSKTFIWISKWFLLPALI